MLEVQAHQQLKHLLRGSAGHWEHELTLSRLVGRSLRRQDRTRIQLSAGSNDRWWLALMVPLALQSRHTVLVLDALQQQRLLQVERPRLMESGIRLSCWTGDVPPPGDQLWLVTPQQLVDLHRDGRLRPQDHLVIPAAETLASRLRLAMALQIDSMHWEQLRTAFPAAGEGLLNDIRARFAIQRGLSVPLPIDFAGRFGSMDEVKALRSAEQAKRPADAPPKIGVMVVTPEKGLRMYQHLLPKLYERWPEAEVHIACTTDYPQQLAHHPNARVLGPVDAASFFSNIDVHLILFETTGSWGRVIGEAGLFGVPSVTSDVGSQKEALGEGGILVDDGHDTNTVIEALMTVYGDRERYGALAREHTQMVDHRRSVAAFRSGLEDLLNNRSSTKEREG